MLEKYKENDKRLLEQIKNVLPNKIFDAHIHLYDASFMSNYYERGGAFNRKRVTFDDYLIDNKMLLEDNFITRANILMLPDLYMDKSSRKEFKEKSLKFLIQELDRNPLNVGEVAIFPEYSIEDVELLLVHPNIIGFKCYHTTSDKKPTFNATINEYLPESVWQVANEREMCITLHMVRDKSLSDEDNFRYITSMCRRYPKAKLILAHCARGFASWTTVEKVEKLVDYENVWFDLSAVCESPAIFQIMKKTGIERLVWGSDYPISTVYGKAISLSDTFYWIDDEDLCSFFQKVGIVGNSVLIESLLAVKQAIYMLELDTFQIEDIFYNNAIRLFNIID